MNYFGRSQLTRSSIFEYTHAFTIVLCYVGMLVYTVCVSRAHVDRHGNGRKRLIVVIILISPARLAEGAHAMPVEFLHPSSSSRLRWLSGALHVSPCCEGPCGLRIVQPLSCKLCIACPCNYEFWSTMRCCARISRRHHRHAFISG